MNEQIQRYLTMAINALNVVTVCGKQNLQNLSGSIELLENVRAMMEQQKQEATMQQEEVQDGVLGH